MQDGGAMVRCDETSDGFYKFEADFKDGCTYTTTIIARHDASSMPEGPLTLDVVLTSPRGDIYIDRVDFPMAISEWKSVKDASWTYRDNVVLEGPESGIWKIDIRPVDSVAARSIVAIGFLYETM